MPSQLNVDTLVAANGTDPVTLTKQSAAKVWNNFNGTSTIAIRGSFGVSSIGDVGTGRYDTNLTNAMSSTDDAAAGGHAGQSNTIYGASARHGFQTTTKYNQYTGDGGTASDVEFVFVIIHGDLA